MRPNKPSIFRGIVTGITAGIAATLVMDQFQKLSTAGQKAAGKAEEAGRARVSLADRARAGAGGAASSPAGRLHRDRRPQDRRSSRNLSRQRRQEEGRTGRPLHLRNADGRRLRRLRRTGPGGHHRRRHRLRHRCSFSPPTRSPFLPFSFRPRPTDTPAFDHLQHWAAHVVYGGSLELVRNLITRLM